MIGLVSCSGPKRAYATTAADLYTSPLFRMSRALVERRCSGWAILSAKHGVVLPHEEIEPYSLELRRLSDYERRVWRAMVRSRLGTLYGGRERFYVLAGSLYVAALDGLDVEDPMRGMEIGVRLSWLKTRLEEAA